MAVFPVPATLVGAIEMTNIIMSCASTLLSSQPFFVCELLFIFLDWIFRLKEENSITSDMKTQCMTPGVLELLYSTCVME